MRSVRASSASPLILLLVFVVHSFVLDAAAVPHSRQPSRTWMNAPRRTGEPGQQQQRNWTQQGVTKVQVEDLDEASTGCVRLRELDFCGSREGPSSWGTARFPNALGHTSEAEAKSSVTDFTLLLRDPSCSHSLRPFLCAALTPACSPGVDDSLVALPPCRSICEAAVDGCEGAMKGSDVRWPSRWSCDRFPKDGVCTDRPLRSDGGSDRTPNDDLGRSQLDWSRTHFIQSRGSLEPPPSSAVDEELLARENNVLTIRRRTEHPGRRPASVRRRPLPPPGGQASGDPRFFRGWVDVQGTGSPNDYCRILGTRPDDRFLSCALNGTGSDVTYISKRGFDVGHPGTWFMMDGDSDGRDDYCRCVGIRSPQQLICMKAGENGFYGGMMQPGSEYTFRIPPSSAAPMISCRQRNSVPSNDRHRETRRRQLGNAMH